MIISNYRMSQRSLSYQYAELKQYQKVNNQMPPQLVSYCTQESGMGAPDISMFDDQLSSIILSITKGDDPNTVVLRNYIKSYINKIHQANYTEYLQKLKALNFTSKENIHYLGSELIVCAIKCPISFKGFTFEEDPKYKSVPEICADVAKQFCSFLVKSETCNLSFHEEIMKLCQQYFYDFVDLNKSLDENNENTSENYKGFMTFMGLLYSRGIITLKVVIDCVDVIKRSIFNIASESSCGVCSKHNDKLFGNKKNTNKLICYYDCPRNETEQNIPKTTTRKHVECLNLYKGYEHLITHVVHSLKSRVNDFLAYVDGKVACSEEEKHSTVTKLEKLGEYLDIIIKSHQEFATLNSTFRSLNKNQLVSPFKPHVMIIHNGIGSSLNELHAKLSEYNKYTTKYKPVTTGKTTEK